jgi:hypoxanthine-guanine phosphoribosyltransferase
MTLETASIKEIKRLQNKWVALSVPDERIVGVGKDAVQAKKSAEKRGEKDIVLMKILPLDSYYAPLA